MLTELMNCFILGRLINITSHCSFTCLPGLSVYGATKAGVKAFSDGLRVELSKYGVKVIIFTPGSFVSESNIMARHPEHVHEMHRAFNRSNVPSMKNTSNDITRFCWVYRYRKCQNRSIITLCTENSKMLCYLNRQSMPTKSNLSDMPSTISCSR
jgi:short-subunit dehydrogenase